MEISLGWQLRFHVISILQQFRWDAYISTLAADLPATTRVIRDGRYQLEDGDPVLTP
jgi:hypothetical protein